MSKPTDREITAWVKSSAKYLREKDLRDRLNKRPSNESLNNHPERGNCFHDYEGFVSELQSIEHDLNAAVCRLQSLHAHFEFGRMQPYDVSGPHIVTALGMASDALAQIRITKCEAELEHPAKNRELSPQKAAVRLAFSMFSAADRRRIRAVAERITLEAGLTAPTPATVTRWLNEIAAEKSANAQ